MSLNHYTILLASVAEILFSWKTFFSKGGRDKKRGEPSFYFSRCMEVQYAFLLTNYLTSFRSQYVRSS